MELPVASRLSARDPLLAVVERYLDALGLAAGERVPLRARLEAAAIREPADDEAALAALHAVLSGSDAPDADPVRASVPARLAAAFGLAIPRSASPRPRSRPRLPTMPPLRRTSMAPSDWLKPPEAASANPLAATRSSSDRVRLRWHATGLARRLALLALIVGQTAFATDLMRTVLPYHGRQPLEIAMLVLFAVLFGWISAGFWTALAGLLVLVGGNDRWAISRTAAPDAPIAPDARTAVVMPIANEDVARAFAGLRATYESLAREGEVLGRFDFYVLSDSGNPDARVAETAAWLDLCRAVGGFDRIFYRWRAIRIKRKSGNVADFCRRWGSQYRYMVVLDADSVMTGRALATLVRLAEANPDAGIIQTAPRATGRDTLYARIQQLATCVYGPLFTAGLHFWQLGESHYWGHNAIIRIEPFMRHCALGRLPGRGLLSGEILSHDFVEAALMRRAGWAVWIAYDVAGSYEELPPSLVSELLRDRRWCQGNLMNARLFPMPGLHPAHRAVFMTGVMAYLSAPLWCLFLLLSTALLALHTLWPPSYFTAPYQLFPNWPEWRPELAFRLLAATAVLLFLPKLLAAAYVAGRGVNAFGGRRGLLASIVGEIAFSALLAPIRMLFHTRFVLSALAGIRVEWRSPPREDAQTTWREAIGHHGVHTLVGIAWSAIAWLLEPAFLVWLLPVAGALALSIPISVLSSRASLGRRARRAGLFLVPEEKHPPREIRATLRLARRQRRLPGFEDAVLDPAINALACATAPERTRPADRRRHALAALVEVASGKASRLSDAQKMTLLGDPAALSSLHLRAWSARPPADAA